ncbi:hypothetical protein PILCRDRAFT_823094 [Piloderma croceum F 1598]|uniref:Uncharacterized protein n=1 Tax=Piloderma croceum (strain F 1598) TaxID=765440 RepID=A0A0C3BRF8_PILCF|nr:hypothetical protein PILCRDRAFT_823094 [Piloderma croceum F 1598]
MVIYRRGFETKQRECGGEYGESSLDDDERSRKLAGGSKKQNVPPKPDGKGRRINVTLQTAIAAAHDGAIELLRQELLGRIDGQADDIRALQSSNTKLLEKVNELTSSNAELKSSNSVFSTTLQRHTKTLHALKRRIVLDDARNKIAHDYSFTFDELRPRHSDIGPLVQRIRSKLNAEDSSLLSNDALTMIFYSSENSVRDGGNKAAHEVPLSDCIDSVLEATLTEARRALLGKIYCFAHGKEPDFETTTA